MKKKLIILALGLVAMMPAKAQWNSWNTSSTISGVFGAINHGIESAERKKAMEIHAKEKVEYEQSFKDAMESAKDYEGGEYWGDALSKYEEAAKLNCNYGYTDQQQITRKINELYVKAGRTEDGPSILNNAKVTLALPEVALRPDFPSPARQCYGVRLHRAFQHLAVQRYQV